MDLWALADLGTPWCLRVVSTLRVAERIQGGTDGVQALAAAAGCDAAALHQVLGHLVGRGIFTEPAPGRFALNEAARGLLDPALHLGLDLHGIGGRMTETWPTLPDYVRTGTTAYRQRFGRTFWEDLEADPRLSASFDLLMGPTGHGTPDAGFPLTGGWASVRTVVDVGGGTGAMLAEILRRHPHVRGILLDLPQTVARADFAEVGDRAETCGQSFFDPLPAGADVYLLRKVLNNWPDAGAAALLRRCAEAARPAGRVVVLQSVGGQRTELAIDMLLTGGHHRTLEEFAALARAAGLEVAAAGPGCVECRVT